MNQNQFSEFLQKEFDVCRRIMDSKSADYSTDSDKLANFKLASLVDGKSPERALYGMDLKHRVSILQGMNDLDIGIRRPVQWWREKICDHINYMFLLLALLTEYNYKTEETSSVGPQK